MSDPNYRAVIMKHALEPSNLVALSPPGHAKVRADGINCSESYQIFLKLDHNSTITNLQFAGFGCLISKATINILCLLLRQKSIREALAIIANYKAMINQKPFARKHLDELLVFQNLAAHPGRIACALLGANALEEWLLARKKE